MAHSNAAWQQTPPRLDAFAFCTWALATAVGAKKSRPKHWDWLLAVRGKGKLVALSGPPLCTCLLRVCFVNAKWFCFCFITLSAVSVAVDVDMVVAMDVYVTVWASVCPARCPGGMVMANPNLWSGDANQRVVDLWVSYFSN